MTWGGPRFSVAVGTWQPTWRCYVLRAKRVPLSSSTLFILPCPPLPSPFTIPVPLGHTPGCGQCHFLQGWQPAAFPTEDCSEASLASALCWGLVVLLFGVWVVPRVLRFLSGTQKKKGF